MSEEQWKPFLETRYDASSLGRIRNRRTGRIMRLACNTNGYLIFHCVDMCRMISVHRAVATAFLPNPDNEPTVDHININPQDNRVENLRWASVKTQTLNRRPYGNVPYKGVSLQDGKYYKAQIRVGGDIKYLGLYNTPEEASAIYYAAAEAYGITA
jgi:hypothetical protein